MKPGTPANNPTPRQLGYRWPAEWEPHAGTWLAWPHNRSTWPGCYDDIPPIFRQLVEILLQWEPVHLLAGGSEIAAPAHAWLDPVVSQAHYPLTWHDIPTNDAWMRDFGPTFLLPNQSGPAAPAPTAITWNYNAWGGKYPPYDLDQRASLEILAVLTMDAYQPPIVLEGGAIEGNGQGTLLTTDSCVLNANRNPGWNRARMEEVFSHYLAIDQVIWLQGKALIGDDTDGHVDQLARFVNEHTVLVATCEDPQDPSFENLQGNLRCLREARLATGQPLEVIPLPLPQPVTHEGQRLPASYCNYLVSNGGIIVPCFEDPHDQVALGILQDCYPDRSVVGLPARELVCGLGAVHCLSQQQPAHPSG